MLNSSHDRLDTGQKRVLVILCLIGLAVFALLIAPNLTGARDVNMLSVFETDEFAQYPHVLRMITPGATFYESIRNFSVYLHYYYGYPFYFFSAVALLPLKLVMGSGWPENTPVIVMYLRQMISVLPMLLAAGLMVWIQTRFRPAWLAITLFAFLLIVPALLVNHFWWHPDSLLVFFVVLTFFFLDRDRLRFGRNFFLAAAACGLATGTKHLGLFFFAAIPVYLIYGLLNNKIRIRRAVLMGLGFVVVMAATIVISNPLLLLPQERAEIIATQKLQWSQSTQGYWLVNLNPYFTLGAYPEDFRQHYGELFFLMLSLLSLGLGILRRDRRLLHLLILAWIIPFSYYFLVIATTHRTHYFLPVALPLFSCLVNFFPEVKQPGNSAFRRDQILWIGRWAVAVLLVIQAGLFLWKDEHLYVDQLNREKNNPSLIFAQTLDQQVFDTLPPGKHVLIYRDWKVYVSHEPGRQVEMNWNLATLDYIRDLNPDIILLERANLNMFSPDSAIENAINPGNTAALHDFYLAAGQDRLPGYHIVLQDGFGVALVRK